jgi:hypothetical protein
MHSRVDLPDGSYTLVPEGDEGTDRGVVIVEQDLDQVQKGQRPTLPTKASPRLS